MKKPLLYLLILVVAVLGSSCSQSSEGTVEVGKNTFLLNGEPFVQSPNQKIPDRKTKCVIKTHINIKQNVIFGAKLKPV